MGRKFFKTKEKSAEELSEERETTLTPVAYQVIDLIQRSDLPIGKHAINAKDQFNKVAQDVIQILLDNQVKYLDKDFVFQLGFRNEAMKIVDRYQGKLFFKDKDGKDAEIGIDRDMISSLVMQPYLMVKDIVCNSLSNNFNRFIDIIIQKPLYDLTVNDMDEFLKKDINNRQKRVDIV